MDKGNTGELGITIGMDVSDRFTEAYALDEHGEWVEAWVLGAGITYHF